MLDALFGPEQVGNEIGWKRAGTHKDARHQFPNTSDRLLFNVKSAKAEFARQHPAHADRTLQDKGRTRRARLPCLAGCITAGDQRTIWPL